ncbi:MAG: MerR family transcriptional regulator [Coriobacteriales bacterium]|nr:MerR family transcriptional regulator [Coriobacteriales bacterium]
MSYNMNYNADHGTRYSIKQLAELAGVTTRALRFYDSIGLLCPKRLANGYRVYEPKDVDRLQMIMFYREMDMPLDEIGRLLSSDSTDAAQTLSGHLATLKSHRKRLDMLIETMERTIATKQGGTPMSDKEKFEAFKKEALRDNEQRYGAEIRERYGDAEVEESNHRFSGMTQEQFATSEDVRERLEAILKQALGQDSPASELAQKAAELHKEWLCFFWSEYSPEKHKGVTQMYIDDPRFREYYDKIAPGTAEFLRNAVWAWLG